MQQTDKYKLNLIETSDPFSPAALNESTQKVESALAAEETARKAGDAQLTGRADSLDTRVTALEVHKIVVGSYVGEGRAITVNLGFTPVAVFIKSAVPANAYHALVLQGITIPTHGNGPGTGTYIIDGGFKVDDTNGLTYRSEKCNYIAFI